MMNIKKGNKKWAILVVLVLFVLSFYMYLKRERYDWVVVKRGEVVEAIYGLGTVKSHSRFMVKTAISSSISKLYVKEGDRVERGDRLVKFSDDNLIKSTIAGIVSLVVGNEGELVQPFQPIIEIVDLEHRFIEVSLEQEGALKVKKGQRVIIVFEDFRNLKFVGSVDTVFSREHEFLVHIQLPDIDQTILPGMTADISIEIGTSKDALLVPLASIRSRHITVRRKNKKKKIEVTIGKIDESWAEVIEGEINEADEVLVMRK